MRYKNRILELAMTMCLAFAVFFMMPDSAEAAGRIKLKSVEIENPVFDDAAETIDLEKFEIKYSKMLATYPGYADTVEEAAASITDAMIARNPVVTAHIAVKRPVDNLQTTFEEISGAILEASWAYSDNPKAGDYLQFNVEGASVEGGVDNTSSYHLLTITYYIDYLSTAEQEQQVDAEIARIRQSLNLTGKTDYQKISAIYDYVCDSISYDNTLSKYSTYNAAIEHTSVCQGYTTLLYRLLMEEGIPCRVIAGTGINSTATGNHAWNIIKLGDLYYNADTTWDSSVRKVYPTRHEFFLKGSSDFDSSSVLYSEHIRKSFYTTAAFMTEFPTSETAYVPGAAPTATPKPTAAPTASPTAAPTATPKPTAAPTQAPVTCVITGSFKSFTYRDGGHETSIRLKNAETGVGVQTVTTALESGVYRYENVEPGSYIIEVSKPGHTTRTYEVSVANGTLTQNVEIWLMGDVTGDGKVNAKDHSRVYAHVSKTNPLSGYEEACGDVTGDGKVNAKDHSRIYAHINKTNPF